MRLIITLITSIILLIPASGQGWWATVDVGIPYLQFCNFQPGNLQDVQFIDRNVGYFVSRSSYGLHTQMAGVLYKTVDGGRTWNIIFCELGQSLSSFHFVNDSNGYIICNGGLYASSDGGVSWTEHTYMNKSEAIFFLNDSTVLAAAGNRIYKTFNGGSDWFEATKYGFDEEIYSLFFIDDSTGWAVGESGLIAKYTLIDGWKDLPDVTDLPLRKVFFIDRDNGWASGGYDSWGESSNIYLRTVDGGETWSEISGLKYMINDFYFVNKDHGWAVGEYNVEQYDYDNGQYIYVDRGVILETFNGGVDWEVVIDELPARLNALHFVDGAGWAVGNDGLVLKNDSTITGIKEDNKINSGNEPLLQNYPNPFQSSTIITYQLPTPNDVELTIYDISGRKVATLVNEKQLADRYEVEWNAEGMNSGIYFCELNTGQGRQVMKMILID